jgi:hypothetical protein
VRSSVFASRIVTTGGHDPTQIWHAAAQATQAAEGHEEAANPPPGAGWAPDVGADPWTGWSSSRKPSYHHGQSCHCPSRISSAQTGSTSEGPHLLDASKPDFRDDARASRRPNATWADAGTHGHDAPTVSHGRPCLSSTGGVPGIALPCACQWLWLSSACRLWIAVSVVLLPAWRMSLNWAVARKSSRGLNKVEPDNEERAEGRLSVIRSGGREL